MGNLNLNTLTVEQLAELLRQAGSTRATVDTIQSDIAAGAPVNQDGTIGLIPFAAWLVREGGQYDEP